MGFRDIREMTENELSAYALVLRERILSAVLKNGGHLSSNLGAVELTLAIHKLYDASKDKIIFDVGHQCYTHKLLTGGERLFERLRASDGLGGFPNPLEEPKDAFLAGHSSTSLSVMCGFLRARKLTGQDFKVVAIVGDGAFTGGMIYEALNDLRAMGEKAVIVLNDNGLPYGGGQSGFTAYLEDIKAGIIEKPFEQYGLEYIGPIDGYDMRLLLAAFKEAEKKNRGVVVHVLTKKGKGYLPAEAEPEKYHGLPRPVDESILKKENGYSDAESYRGFSSAAGEILLDLAEKDSRIVAVTAAMKDGTGLARFSERFPDRFFDVGICEPHAVTMSAAMSKGGLIPFVAVYSSFLQRAFDNILHDVCIMGNNVKFLVDRAGLIPEDGETHQGIFDVGFLSQLPKMRVLAPENYEELRLAMKEAVAVYGPIAIRYPKARLSDLSKEKDTVRSVRPIDYPYALLVTGAAIKAEAVEAARLCRQKGLELPVFYSSKIKPLDVELLSGLSNCRKIFVLEDSSKLGGFGGMVSNFYSEKRGEYADNGGKNIPAVEIFAVEEDFPSRGTYRELLKRYGLDGETVAKKILKSLDYGRKTL